MVLLTKRRCPDVERGGEDGELGRFIASEAPSIVECLDRLLPRPIHQLRQRELDTPISLAVVSVDGVHLVFCCGDLWRLVADDAQLPIDHPKIPALVGEA